MAECRVVCGFFVIFLLFFIGNAERTKDKMYSSIVGASCIRRLNATHQTGCSSTSQGSVGALHFLTTADDLQWILENGTSPPYAPVMTPAMFTPEVMFKLKSSFPDRVSAVILTDKNSTIDNFSQESKCPNQFSGLSDLQNQYCDNSKPWNPFGTNLLHEDFPFPVIYISENQEIEKLYHCFQKFNNFDVENQYKRSLCSIELSSFMAAAVNSEVCYRRSMLVNTLSPVRYCDPLGDRNVYSTLFPRIKLSDKTVFNSGDSETKLNADFEYKIENNELNLNSVSDANKKQLNKQKKLEKFIMVTARLDTTSMFVGVSPGAMGSLVALTTLISTASWLRRSLGQINEIYNTNILFMFLNGESYDYIGSQRLVFDMDAGVFPPDYSETGSIDVDQIDMLVEINSIGNNLFSHSIVDNDKKINNFTLLLNKYSTLHNLNIKTNQKISSNIPPSSSQTFLKKKSTLPTLVLTDFETSFSNRFYHSIYDNEDNINYKYHNTSYNKTIDVFELLPVTEITEYHSDSVQILIRNVSTVLGMALYTEITGNDFENDTGTNPYVIDEILYCYLQSADCPLFRAASPPGSPRALDEPPSRYVGVAGYLNDVTRWTGRVLTLLGGVLQDKNETSCQDPSYWVAGFTGNGSCYHSTVNFTLAVSPAFFDEVPGYNWTSGQYSTWTESTWKEISARMFLRPSRSHEVTTIVIGVIVMILSFIVVYFLDKRSHLLFPNSVPAVTQVGTHC